MLTIYLQNLTLKSHTKTKWSPSFLGELLILKATWPQRTSPAGMAGLKAAYSPGKELTGQFGCLYADIVNIYTSRKNQSSKGNQDLG